MSERVEGQELRQIVERIERLEAEKQDAMALQKEVYAEAKGRGYDSAILRKIVAMRKKNAADLSEEQAVLEMYMQALGMV